VLENLRAFGSASTAVASIARLVMREVRILVDDMEQLQGVFCQRSSWYDVESEIAKELGFLDNIYSHTGMPSDINCRPLPYQRVMIECSTSVKRLISHFIRTTVLPLDMVCDTHVDLLPSSPESFYIRGH
jgi:hypothetical protein